MITTPKLRNALTNLILKIDSEIIEAITTEHNSFFAYTLLLIIKDNLKEVRQLGVALDKVSNLVRFVHKLATIATNVIKREEKN